MRLDPRIPDISLFLRLFGGLIVPTSISASIISTPIAATASVPATIAAAVATAIPAPIISSAFIFGGFCFFCRLCFFRSFRFLG